MQRIHPSAPHSDELDRDRTRPFSGFRPRVLIVDDEPSVLAFLAVTLQRAGYDVFPRGSLAEGMATLDQGAFELVLSDLYLGSDLAYCLAEKASRRTPRVPVILLTGRPTFTGAAEALKSRVAEIVAKPIDPALLVSTCRRTIKDHSLRSRNEELEAQNKVLDRGKGPHDERPRRTRRQLRRCARTTLQRQRAGPKRASPCGAAARRRQDRHPRRDPVQARRADAGRARRDPAPPADGV